MKVDIALPAADPAEAGRAARAFEEHGFDGVLSFEGPHDPFLPLVLAAQATTGLELTTAVAIALARNPMVCAYMANDLQLISRGRFRLGLGSQIRPHIEKRFSQTWSRPNARMREFVLAMRAIFRSWNERAPLRFEGEIYRHTLMPPFFSPGPNPFGPPPILLAGFGPSMIEIAGEVADGWIIHPLHSVSYVDHVALPALHAGAARAGRDPATIEISAQTIVMVGSDEAQIARARQGARLQLAFYGSTPAYRGMLEHHGWGALQPELNRMTREGRWGEMSALISDQMLAVVGVCGTPLEVGRKLRERNRFARRTSLVLYDETGDAATLATILDGLRADGAAA